MELVGRWQKVSTEQCTEKYPHIIHFDSAGLYTTSPGNSAVHPIWDVGTFRAREKSIDISTSYDAIINYIIEITDQKLTLKDPEGCLVVYQPV